MSDFDDARVAKCLLIGVEFVDNPRTLRWEARYKPYEDGPLTWVTSSLSLQEAAAAMLFQIEQEGP